MSTLEQVIRDVTKTVAKNGAQDITFKHDRIASVAGKYGEAR